MQGESSDRTPPGVDTALPPASAAVLSEAGSLPEELARIRDDLEDALAAARHKQAAASTRLQEAHDEAQSIVADAADQAMLVSEAATRAADELTTQAETDAAEERAAVQAAARALRDQAEQIMLGAQREADELRRDVLHELDDKRQQDEVTRTQRQAEFDADLVRTTAEHDQQMAHRHAEADAARAALVAQAERELEQARQHAERERVQASTEAEQLIEQARRDAAAELATAAEQMAWTQQVVARLVEAADLEGGRTRSKAHRDAASIIRRTRQRLSAAMTATEQAIEQRRAEAIDAANALQEQAKQQLAQAAADADRHREKARREAQQILDAATEEADARTARAERRLAEAESGAKALRQRVADEVAKAQREMQDVRRSAKAEATQTITDARAEADQLRTQARTLLADARAEVAALTQRRNDITSELGNLSGVIEALAVSEHAPDPAPRRPQPVATKQAEPAAPALSPPTAERTVDEDDSDKAHEQPGTFLLHEMMRAE